MKEILHSAKNFANNESAANVLQIYKKNGHINRSILVNELNISQRQAGYLMREFIKEYASDLAWHPTEAHYKFHDSTIYHNLDIA